MNHDFITQIKKDNSLTNLTKIYDDISAKESAIWESIEANITNWTTLFSQKADAFSNNCAVIEVSTAISYSYADLESASNNIAAYIQTHISDTNIGLCYPNSFLFLATLIAINKCGRLAILFNNRDPETTINTQAKEHNIHTILGKNVDISMMLDQKCQAKPQHILNTTLEDPAFVIFTSGTSGKSKAALFSHRRMIGAGIAWSIRAAMTQDDHCYIPLPLYHGNALAVAYSSVVFCGATAVLREKFSVSEFWHDINTYHCSHMIYIGELWRYLLNRHQGKNPNQSLKVIFGNGLTKSLWSQTIQHFAIEHVVEHFGATEMPAGALTNWTNQIGFCGFIPNTHIDAKRLLLVDKHFTQVDTNRSGEAIFTIPKLPYRGYLDSSLDEAKICNSSWWRSGDLLQKDSAGFFTFIERMGDSYRYKGENIASVDVEAVLLESNLFEEVVVYGISLAHMDGKIGMASLTPKGAFSCMQLTHIYHFLHTRLSSYAMPYIIKINTHAHQTTSTLKIQKAHLAKIALDEYKSVPHYLLLNEQYVPLDETHYVALQNNEIQFGTKSTHEK